MIKWYGYVSQVARMFDKELHKEYVFLSYLFDLLPSDTKPPVDLEGKIKLEFYKLRKTFEGSIALEEKKGVFEPASGRDAKEPEKKEPLDEIIERINERFKGPFTDGDRVILNALLARFMRDSKLKSQAKTTDPLIFEESVFPKAFEKAALDSYKESRETFESLFSDKAKYDAVMRALAEVVYRDMRSDK